MAKIMLVEDDDNLREIYGARLEAEGYSIVAAKDGEEALALAVKEKPDLIISDVMMPRISGFDMLDILRNAPETKETKVIMMTALSQAEDKARADKLGADRYLVKSQVTLEDVANVVKDVLAGTPEGGAATEAPITPTVTDITAVEVPNPETSAVQSSEAPAEPLVPAAEVSGAAESSPVEPVNPAPVEPPVEEPAPEPKSEPSVDELIHSTPAPEAEDSVTAASQPAVEPVNPAPAPVMPAVEPEQSAPVVAPSSDTPVAEPTVEEIANPVVEVVGDEGEGVQPPPGSEADASSEEISDPKVTPANDEALPPVVEPALAAQPEAPAPVSEPATEEAPAPSPEAVNEPVSEPATAPAPEPASSAEPAPAPEPIKVELPKALDEVAAELSAEAEQQTPEPAPETVEQSTEDTPSTDAIGPSLAEALAAEESQVNQDAQEVKGEGTATEPAQIDTTPVAQVFANGAPVTTVISPTVKPEEAPAPEETPVETPASAPEETPDTAGDDANLIKPEPSAPKPAEPAPEPPQTPVKTASGQKVIQPLNDPLAKPNLEALLAEEEKKEALANPPANTVITPSGNTETSEVAEATPAPAQKTSDNVNNIAL